MTTEDTNNEVKTPQGWAIVGAFLGVLFAYIGTMEFSSQIGTVAIIAAGIFGAIVMNEIEYQVISNTGKIRTNINGIKNSATSDSNNSYFSSGSGFMMNSLMLDLYKYTSDINDIDSIPENKPKAYFVQLNLSNDELTDFVHEHQDQLSIYPSYLIVKEKFDEGLILLNPALLSEDASTDVGKAIWYNTSYYPKEGLENDYSHWKEYFNYNKFEWEELSEFEDIPEYIKEMIDNKDDSQSSS